MSGTVRYRRGYKYQLESDYTYTLPENMLPYCAQVKIPDPLNPFFLILPHGAVYVFRGYAWDGASGPTLDTKSSIRGSLIHDVLYQAIRLRVLAPECRPLVDELLYQVCVEDGMLSARARMWYYTVRAFAGTAAEPTSERPVLTAP